MEKSLTVLLHPLYFRVIPGASCECLTHGCLQKMVPVHRPPKRKQIKKPYKIWFLQSIYWRQFYFNVYTEYLVFAFLAIAAVIYLVCGTLSEQKVNTTSFEIFWKRLWISRRRYIELTFISYTLLVVSELL